MTTSPTVSAIREFACTLEVDAERLDWDEALLYSYLQRFAATGLHRFGSTALPLSAREAFECLASFAEYSGAFGFLVLQQWVANLNRKPDESSPYPRLGVAFGHLRNPKSPSPILKDGKISGTVPWMTGYGMVEEIWFGFRSQEGEETYVWLPATPCPEITPSNPLPLIACRSTHTVRFEIENLAFDARTIVSKAPAGTLARADANSVVFHTPLMIGNLRASLKWIRVAKRLSQEVKDRTEAKVNSLLETIFAALEDGSHNHIGAALRAQASETAVRLARLATMATGGSGLYAHPTERLYREALLFSLMATTDAIVERAFEEFLQ